MEFQEFVPSVPYVASVLVVGLFLWRVFARVLSGMEARFNDRFGQIESRFDDRFKEMNDRFDVQFAHMEKRSDDRFVSMEKRFDDRFVSMEKQFDDRFVSMEKQFDDRFVSLEKQFDDRFVRIEHQYEGIRGQFASLEKKVDGLADDHDGLSRELSEFRGEMRGRLSLLGPQAAGDT